MGETSIFSTPWDLKFEAHLITKAQKLSFGQAELSYDIKRINLIHDGETPTIFEFSAKNFDSD